jgi:hypothetical protein
VLRSPEGCLKTVRSIDLSENIVKMGFDGMAADAEFVGNPCV